MSSSSTDMGEDEDGCTVVYNIPPHFNFPSHNPMELRIECLSFDRHSDISSKWTHLNLCRHLQASVAADFISKFNGAAKYCQDDSDLNQVLKVVRLQLLVKTDELQSMPDEKPVNTATHVVTRICYGVEAFCVFRRNLNDGELMEDIEDAMESTLNQLIHSLLDRKELNCSNFGWATFYGDLHPDSRDCSLVEAYELLRKLIETVETDPTKAVPVTVWLRPTEKANSFPDLDDDSLNGCLQFLDGISRSKGALNTFLRDDEQMKLFPHIRKSFRDFLKCLTKYSTLFRQELNRLLPSIRSGENVKNPVTELIAKAEDFFNQEKFCHWQQEKLKEIRALRIVARLAEQEKLPLIQNQTKLDAALFDVSCQWTVVLMLPKLDGRPDRLLDSMVMYTENNRRIVRIRPSTSAQTDEEIPWYVDENIFPALVKVARRMLQQIEINKEDGLPVSFLMTPLKNEGNGPYIPKLELYKEGQLASSDFHLPSPPTGLGLLVKSGKVVLGWKCSEFSSDVTYYEIQYKLIEGPDSSWTCNRTTSTSTSVELRNIKDPSGYQFRVAAVSAVGRSAFSSVFQPDPVVETEPPIPEQDEIRENKNVEMPIERDQVVRQMEKFENLF